MITQYEKNSISIAKTKYSMKKRKSRLKTQLALFFAALAPVCGALYIAVSSLG